jgi:hypothetical protein
MTKRRGAPVEWMLVSIAVSCIVGCQSPPFLEVERVPLSGVDPEQLRLRFASALPERFRVVSSVSFHYFGRAFSALGLTDVDAAKKTFTIVGLHPAGGVKLFELTGDAVDVEVVFIHEEFTRRGDFARVVAADMRRMYFDRVPAPSAKSSRGRRQIVFRQWAGDGELEYVFAGANGVLVKKRYYEGDTKIWSVSYYEYRRRDGKLHPIGIVLEHHEHGYRLVVRLKEILS